MRTEPLLEAGREAELGHEHQVRDAALGAGTAGHVSPSCFWGSFTSPSFRPYLHLLLEPAERGTCRPMTDPSTRIRFPKHIQHRNPGDWEPVDTTLRRRKPNGGWHPAKSAGGRFVPGARLTGFSGLYQHFHVYSTMWYKHRGEPVRRDGTRRTWGRASSLREAVEGGAVGAAGLVSLTHGCRGVTGGQARRGTGGARETTKPKARESRARETKG